MQQKAYLNNTSKEDLELIKNDIQNLNDYYTKSFPKHQNIESNQQPKEEIKDKIQKDNNNNQNNQNKIKDSRKLSEPIINHEYFYSYIKSQTKSKFSEKIKMDSFNYKTLQQTLIGCGSYPESARKYIWRYLLSLPNNTSQFFIFSGKGIHPLYLNFEKNFPLNENQMLIRLQKICSLISFWSYDIGKINYLPKIIFPFLKSFPGDDIFVFETVMAVLYFIYKYFFEFYPNFPVTHIKLVEEIIRKETNGIIHKIFSEVNLPLNELIWHMIKFLFSESFKKNDWLALLDFLITYNHKPEMILYFCSAFFILSKNDISSELKLDQKNFLKLFIDSKQRREMNKLFNLSLYLYNKYSKTLQEFIYEPYYPQEEKDKYRTFNLTNNFYDAIEKMKNDIFKGNFDYDIQRQLMMNDDYKIILENKYRELCNREKEIENCRKDILEQEKRKNDILKLELDIITHQRDATIKKIESISNN